MSVLKGFLAVVEDLPDVLAMMSQGWLGWFLFAAVFLFVFLSLRAVWNGRLKTPIAAGVISLLVGLAGYVSAFQIGDYEGMAVLFLSAIVIIVAIITLVLAVPVYVLRGRSAGQIESEI